MAVWLIADDGRRLKLLDEWRPRAYLKGGRAEAERVAKWVERQGVPATLERKVKQDFMTGAEVPAWELRVGDAAGFGKLMAGARARFPALEFFDADIHVDRLWFYETRRHPLARVDAEMDGGILRAMACRDSIWDLDYELPPFVTMGLRAEGPEFLHPRRGGRRGGLEVHTGDDVRVLDTGDAVELLSRLAEIIRGHDPDILVTEHGDGWLLPVLAEMSQRTGISLPLNRDSSLRPRVSPSRSYFTYGRIMHTDETWVLRGRLHLDRRNSFTISAAGFDGLYETARLARIPVQASARSSTGTGISSMQVARAVEEGILVPVDKRVTEEFMGADELLEVDKGGLVFQPEPGVHEGVGELDFASMYPSIMVKHNLSPETVGCACCREDGETVPELGLRSCRRRTGLIPRVLAPLLAKRALYKELKRSAPAEAVRNRAKARADAHKWMLVCCFGYLGYRNARFGRIEAHEATTAWGRETLLRAKETAEGAGFRVLHAIVDCIWVVKEKNGEFFCTLSPKGRPSPKATRLGAPVRAEERSPRSERGPIRPDRGEGEGIGEEGKSFASPVPSPSQLEPPSPALREREALASGLAAEYAALAKVIERDTGLPVSLEGAYRWLAFLPSRADPERGVAQRYLGVFESGEVRARGIEARRADTPPFVRELQLELLEEMGKTRTIAEARRAAESLRGRVEEAVREVRAGRLRTGDLVVTTRLSRSVREYSRSTPAAVAAQQLYSRGVRLEPGESVGYVLGEDRPCAVEIREDGAPYDAGKYAELALRAARTVLEPFGVVL